MPEYADATVDQNLHRDEQCLFPFADGTVGLHCLIYHLFCSSTLSLGYCEVLPKIATPKRLQSAERA